MRALATDAAAPMIRAFVIGTGDPMTVLSVSTIICGL